MRNTTGLGHISHSGSLQPMQLEYIPGMNALSAISLYKAKINLKSIVWTASESFQVQGGSSFRDTSEVLANFFIGYQVCTVNVL